MVLEPVPHPNFSKICNPKVLLYKVSFVRPNGGDFFKVKILYETHQEQLQEKSNQRKIYKKTFQGRVYFSFERSITFSIGLHRFPLSFAEICVSRLEVRGLAHVSSFSALQKAKFSTDLRLCHI